MTEKRETPERVTDFSETVMRISEHDYYHKLTAEQRVLLNTYSMPPGRQIGNEYVFNVSTYRIPEIDQAGARPLSAGQPLPGGE